MDTHSTNSFSKDGKKPRSYTASKPSGKTGGRSAGKPSGKPAGKSGYRSGGKSEGKYAGKSEGGYSDKPRKPKSEGAYGEKPRKSKFEGGSGDKSYKPKSEGGYGDKSRKPKTEGGFSDKPRKPKFEGNYGDKPYKSKADGGFGDKPRKPRSEGGYGDKPYKPKSDKPQYAGKSGKHGEGASKGGYNSRRDDDFKPRRDFADDSQDGFGKAAEGKFDKKPRSEWGGKSGGKRSDKSDGRRFDKADGKGYGKPGGKGHEKGAGKGYGKPGDKRAGKSDGKRSDRADGKRYDENFDRKPKYARDERPDGRRFDKSDGKGYGKADGKRSGKDDGRRFDKSDGKGYGAGKSAAKPSRWVCPQSKRCGACTNIERPYDEQLEWKNKQMQDMFADIADQSILKPIIGMADPFHYRNKVISPFAPGPVPKGAKAKTGEKPAAPVLTGMYAAGTHDLVNTDGCAVENADANEVVVAVRAIMERYGMLPYNEDTGAGFVRHVVVRVGHTSGEMLVTLVTNEEEFPSSKSFCKELVSRCPKITTVVQNINTRNTNVIMGDKERTLFGPGFILDELCGLSFRISSRSFYQVNAVQTEVLYKTAINAAGLTGTETVIDAYCGTGTIGLVAAKGVDGAAGAARVIGVDNVPAAIHDAVQNARHNGIENAAFATHDATEFMKRLAAERRSAKSGAADNIVLMMDPPRAGSTPEFLQAAATLRPARIVYISCNPFTQVRDLRVLLAHGYQLKTVQPVDMFPHTPHVETVALLSRVTGGSR